MAITKGPKQSKRQQNKTRKEEDGIDKADTEKGGKAWAGAVGGKGSGGPGGDESDICIDCGKEVLASQTGLKCDSCGFWHHAPCECISDDIYYFLQEHSKEPSLLWYCRKCLVTSKNMVTVMSTMQGLEDRMAELASTMNKKVEDLTNIVCSQWERYDEKGVKTLDEAEVNDTHKRVEEKVDRLMEKVEKQKLDGHYVHDCVEDAVRLKLQKDKEEEEEIRKRRTSLIIHGLKESTDTEAEVRKKSDEDQIVDMLHEIKCDKVSIHTAIRLGKKNDSVQGKPRPLKVVVASEEQKEIVLRQSKNLRSKKEKGLDKVFIHQDMTPKQREERQALVKEMKERQTKGEQNLIIVNGKIVIRKSKESQEMKQ
jgi:hypothetical protein